MLPAKNRLKKKKDFERVFKEGRGAREDFLFLKLVKNNSGFNRIAFIVGKNVSKKASQRNKVKRIISEIVRLRLKNLKPGIDGVFVALPGAEKKDFRQTEKTIDKLLLRSKITPPLLTVIKRQGLKKSN